MLRVQVRLCCLLLLLGAACLPACAYSVLTHEALVDAAWEAHIRPALGRKFPLASPDELREARAYLYGGSILQDIGYYPFGSKLFSDLTHYVRSGDFVLALLDEARDLNEYAFALGALEHYAGDSTGHPLGVNPAVPLVYPKVGARYGRRVTYEDDPTAHVRTEFGFDVLQAAAGRYAPQAYHDFIGFEVAKPALERAFLRTYGLALADVFASVDLALGTFRRTVCVFRGYANGHFGNVNGAQPAIAKRRFRRIVNEIGGVSGIRQFTDFAFVNADFGP